MLVGTSLIDLSARFQFSRFGVGPGIPASEIRLATEGLRIPLSLSRAAPANCGALPGRGVFPPLPDGVVEGGEDFRDLVDGPFRPEGLGIPGEESGFSVEGLSKLLTFIVCVTNRDWTAPGLFLNPDEIPGDSEFG